MIRVVDGGVYIAIFQLSTRRRISVGRLGTFWFQPGVYFYVGSAQRNLTARIERHGRTDKPLRWHVDYLSSQAIMLGAIILPGARSRECELARELRSRVTVVIPGFGSSDCRCPGHLLYSAATRCWQLGNLRPPE
jgi:sugar fermentation stimulation protein A